MNSHVVLDGKFLETHNVESAIYLGEGKLAVSRTDGVLEVVNLETKNEVTWYAAFEYYLKY